MTYELFLTGLMIVSVMTGLTTEAVKKVLADTGRTYSSNILAGVVAAVLAVAVSIAYLIMTGTAFTDKMAVIMIALILLSWLSAMVGYDKVIQAISQFKIK